MNEIEQKILDFLPKDGSKVSGGEVKAGLKLQNLEYKRAKEWLKDNNLVITGRGRGGTIAKIDGVKPPEEKKKPSRSEIMAFARAEKEAKRTESSKRSRIRTEALAFGWEKFPDADEINAHPYEFVWYLEVWKDRRASIYTIPSWELSYD